MGKGGMPRKNKKDDWDWDNPDSLADLEKEPEDIQKTGISEAGESKGSKKKDNKKAKEDKKKGGKNDNADPLPQPDRFHENDEAEIEGKGGKKGRGGRRVSFGGTQEKASPKDQNESYEESSEEEEEEEQPKGKQGKGKPAPVNFAALANDDDDDDDEESEEEKPAPAKKSAFAALPTEEEDEDEEDEEDDEEKKKEDAKGKGDKKAAARGKKGKKGKKGDDSDDDEKSPTLKPQAAGKAKPKAAPPKAPVSFASLMGDDEGGQDDEEEEEEEKVEKKTPKKEDKKDDKKKDKKKEEKSSKSAPAVADEVALPSLSLEEQKILKKALEKCVFKGVCVGLIKGIDKHPKANDLFVCTVSDGGFGEAQVVTNNTKIAVGMKVAFAPVGSEVFDEELGAGTTTIKAIKLKNVNSAGMLCSGKLLGLNEDAENVLQLPATCPLGIDVGEAYIRLVKPEVLETARKAAEEARIKAEEAAAAKRAAKAAKEAEQAKAAPAEGAGAEDDDKGGKGKKKGGKDAPKVNAKLAAIQEMQKKLREEQERVARLEEERKKAEEEALRIMKEEEEAAEAARKAKKEKKKEKEEQLRKEGKLLSKKQKAEKEKNEAYRKQLEAQGIVPPRAAKEGDDDADDSDEEESAAAPKDGQPKKLTKNEIKQMEKDRKDRLKALQEERERRAKEAEEAAAEAARRAKELENIVDNWEEDAEAPADGDQKDEESEDDSDGEGSEYDSDGQKLSKTAQRARRAKKKAEARRLKRMEQNLQAKSRDNLRCPVICVLGHVDTGKTKILDKIRRTNVQDGEAGGITQQIGASYFPVDAITEKTLAVKQLHNAEYNVPGLLIIDTPGHESFTNLRTRGSSLCDLAVLVVDIMHGLEPQTIESIGLLKKRRAPFIIAFNKIDRLYGWEPMPELPVQQALQEQKKNVQDEFKQRYDFTVNQLAEQGLNACVFYDNKDVRTFINMVPTSAISGDGMMDLLYLLTTLPSKMLVDKIMYHDNLECTVLEVKAIEGLGTTMDVIVVNGRLKEKQTVVVCGLDGPIVTQIRSLLTPQPMKEMRVKTPYLHHSEIQGAIGVKICANGIERALAGSNLLVLGEDDDVEELKDEVMKDLGGILKKVKKNEDGVYVQASTLGSLEALLQFLESPGEDRDGRPNKAIPVSGIGIGPVSKYDVMRCGVMLEREREWVKMCEKEHAATGDWISGNPLNSIKEAYACILAFDVPVLPDAERLAKEIGIVIYTAEIIYHLFDKFMKRVAEIKAKKKEEAGKKAVYPCVFKIVDDRCIFNKKDPYILGIDVLEGVLKIGTPVCIPNKPWTGDAKTQETATELLEFGQVMSIEKDKKPVDSATRQTGNVAIRIEQKRNMKEYTLGRHWDHTSIFLSKLNRESIDLLKEHFREDIPKDDWKLIVKLKKVQDIQ